MKLATAALVFAAGASFVLPAPAQAFCDVPLVAAQDYVDDLPSLTGPGYCDTDKEAESTCRLWLKQCKKRVNAATKCSLALVKTDLAFSLGRCKLPNHSPDPKACRTLAKGSAAQQRSNLKANQLLGREHCEANELFCRGQCKV